MGLTKTIFVSFVLLVLNFMTMMNILQEDYAEETVTHVILKTLPILCLVIGVYCKRFAHPKFDSYRLNILIGLVLSLCGNFLFVWRVDYFLPGMAFFLVAYLFYSNAFTFKPLGGHTGLVMLLAGFTTFAFVMDSVYNKQVKVSVFFYTVAIMTMIWRAVVRWQNEPTMSNLYASLGGFLFGISDFLLILDKYQMHLSLITLWVMLTYYAAQFFITLSVLRFDNVVGEFDYSRDKKKG